MNKDERHIEQFEVYENNLNNRAFDKLELLEDIIIKKFTFEEVINAID